MRAVLFLFFATLSFFAAGQSDDRVKLRDLQAATGDGQVIQSLNDTSRWVVPPWADSISVLQDSIVVLYSDGSEVARDTVGPFGGATTVYYQTLRDDGTPVTQRDAINFVATSTVATTLTDDAGNGETEVALSVIPAGVDHGGLAGLADDDHTQYALLAGRASGQTLNGGTASGENLNLSSTAHATKGNIVFSADEMGWTRASISGNMIIHGNTIKTTDGQYNIGIGQNVFSNTMSATSDGNIGIGASCFSAINSASADFNTAIGYLALEKLTEGSSNVALGSEALRNLTTGTSNFGLGGGAGLAFTTQSNNLAIGTSALRASIGTANIGIGSDAARLKAGGDFNVSIGYQARYSATATGDQTVAIGYQAGYDANQNNVAIGREAGKVANAGGVFLGYQAGLTETGSDRLYIDNSSTTSPLIGGNFSSNYLGVNTAVASLGAALHVTGTGATSATVNLFAENSSGTDLLYLDNSGQLGLKTNLPARTLHVAGETRITDLTTDAPTRIVGADADGDLNEITVSSELLLSGGVLSVGTLSHAALSDLGSPEDDHDQYLNIFGRAGGQIVYGATGASENLDLNSTTNATKGNILLQDEGGNVIIGGAATASRLRMMEASGSGTNYTEFVTQAQAANVTYTLPADDGDAGEQLQTNGSGSLSWQPPGGDIDFEVYDVAGSYTYNIPTGAKAIDIITIGGGGGGGSGRKGATTDANTGGGGGGGGGYSRVLFVVSELSASSLDIDVGAGGTGGASVSTSSTNGSGGADGEITTVYCSGFLLCAGGPGDGGGGGSTGASTGGVDATIGDVLGQNGGSCATDGVAAAGDASNNKAPGGGGSGGGIPAGGTPAKNGSRSAKYNYGQDQITNNGTVASPDAGDATANAQQITGGGGGAGGASSIASSGGDGGDGIMGSGGGGGGAALNGVGDSGAGGAGGTGWVLLIVKY